MATVFVRSVTDDEPGRWSAQDRAPALLLRQSAALDASGPHQIATDPATADLVLFAENHEDTSASGLYLERVRADRVYREYSRKAFLCSGLDRVVPFLPGVYPSVPARLHRPWWTAGGMYLAEPNPWLQEIHAAVSPRRYAASFLGSAQGRPVRIKLLTLADQPEYVVEDTHEAFVGAIKRGESHTVLALKRRYLEIAAQSDFVLCPRGIGPSSIRLFEVMELGVAPVIIADDWVEPPGVAWNQCSLRVAERDVPRLPEIVRQHRDRAEAMGRAAREAWLRQFAPGSRFRAIADACLDIARHPEFSRARGRMLAWQELARRPHPQRLARRWKNTLLGRT
jgi:hypothetical protein